MITHYNIITRAALIICLIFAANFSTHAQEDISDDEVVTDSLLTDTITTHCHGPNRCAHTSTDCSGATCSAHRKWE